MATSLKARVKKGVALLDAKIPNWRHILRRNKEQYKFSEYDHCIVGTIFNMSEEHKKVVKGAAFTDGLKWLLGTRGDPMDMYHEAGVPYGLDVSVKNPMDMDTECEALARLWEAEINDDRS